MNKQYHVGIYCRLSVDDASNTSKAGNFLPDDESASIENQRELLSRIVMINGWVETKTYIDDGYSGGNFNRPGFQEMLEDARNGVINLILVKDLSRLGRDFVEVGRYTTDVFPSLGVRFVSVLDSLDTDSEDTDMLHFRSLMNDYHLRDLSNKVRSVLHSKKLAGQYAVSAAPYGYVKDPDDKHKLLIDEDAAPVIRTIFEMRKNGTGYNKIAAYLNREGITSPRLHMRQISNKSTDSTPQLWTCTMVKHILKNETYCGRQILNRYGTVSYKKKVVYHKPESEWICHEGAHEAIITQETWDAVQMINQQAKMRQTRGPQTERLFSHKLVCADCQRKMNASVDRKPRKNGPTKAYVYYLCSIFLRSGSSVCTPHRIYEKTLVQIVTEEIREQARAVTLDEDAVREKLLQRLSGESKARFSDLMKERGLIHRRIEELENMTAALYEDKISGVISADTFSVLMNQYETERLARVEREGVLQSEIEKLETDEEAVRSWAQNIRKYMDLQDLNREVVEELIDHIEIGEAVTVDGQRRQSVKVFYRFLGAVE